jgi:hypothetical protein
MPDPKPKIPTLAEAFALREPNELEKRMAAERQPGYIPPGEARWILDHLPPNDPRRVAAKRLEINGQLTEEALRELFK